MSTKNLTAAAIGGVAVMLMFLHGCDGSRNCSSCNGTGMVNVVDSWSGQWATVPCPACGGTGKIPARESSKNTHGLMMCLFWITLAVSAIGRGLWGNTKIGKALFGEKKPDE